MEKPTTVARQEFAESLVQLVNNSGLHPLITIPVLVEMTEKLNTVLAQLTEKEKQEYEASLKKEKQDGE